MTTPMTSVDLRRPNDLLIQYDHLPAAERFDWLQHRVGDFDLAYAFDLCARDESFRGFLELRWNANMPLEAFVSMRSSEVREVRGERFRSHVPCISGERFLDVVAMPGRAVETDRPPLSGPG